MLSDKARPMSQRKLFTLYIKLSQPRDESVFREEVFAFLSVYSDKQLFCLRKSQLIIMLIEYE